MRTAPILFFLLAGMLGSLAHAADPDPKAAAGKPDSCIDVEVDGHRAPSYDCLSQQMAPAQPPDHGTPPGLASSDALKNQPNQLGLFNQAATRTRMGNTFGTSAFPQRPPPAGTSPIMNGR